MKNKNEIKCGVVIEPTPEPINGKLHELVELLEDELNKYENLAYSVKNSLNKICYIDRDNIVDDISTNDNTTIINRLQNCINYLNDLNELHSLNVEHLNIIV